ncbi:hypothetical protein LSM04_004466 [Trypanosoma melophagium]|uniref:uncharacterized protein n=1 Tax=Trypanosoma melophagium TaxID=715481 RepID=UPI00351A1B50|nr:hypothetical protein LSM04_004466 [Trypanosoma melophagium]
MTTSLREVVIGTDDNDAGSCTTEIEATGEGRKKITKVWDEHFSQPPEPAEVEICIASLRSLVNNNGTPIESTDFEHINTIVDRLDQVYYWVVEEATTFIHEPSVLKQCETPQLVLLCLNTKRPKIIMAALRILRYLMHHEECGRCVFEAAATPMLLSKDEKKTTEIDDNNTSGGKAFYDIIADVMERYEGVIDIQVEAAAIAAEAARLDIEGFLHSLVISHVLTALQRHGDNATMQKEGVRLFATLVYIPRDSTCVNILDDFSHAPLAVLLSQIGVVVDFVVKASNTHANNLDIKRHAVHFFRRCASFPENVPLLLEHGVYSFLVRTLIYAMRTPELFVELIEAIAYFISLLDVWQKRSLLLVVRRLLLRTTSSSFISLSAALLVRVLQTVPDDGGVLCSQLQTMRLQEQEGKKKEEREENKATIPFNRVELVKSEKITLKDDDTRQFMTSCFIPQLLCVADDNFGEEDAVLRRSVKEFVRLLSQQQHLDWR